MQQNITAEKNRAERAENTLQQKITAEKNRAERAESTLQQKITAERNARIEGLENERDVRRQEIQGMRDDVLDLIHEYRPIEIEGNVVNAPDEEDITQQPNNLLKFKDKDYNPTIFSGLGRKYLRKNIIINEDYMSFDGFEMNPEANAMLEGQPDSIFWDRLCERFIAEKDGVYYLDWQDSGDYIPINADKIYVNENIPYFWNGEDLAVDDDVIARYGNILTQEMMPDANTIYVIQYDYNLNGAEITVPANCVLKFEGGSISNGTLTGQGTGIQANLVKIFNTNIDFRGTWNIEEVYPEWFGAKGDGIVDDTIAFTNSVSIVNSANSVVKLVLQSKKYVVTGEITINKDVVIEGNNANIYFKGIGTSFYGIYIVNGTSTTYYQETSCSGITMGNKSKRINCVTVDPFLKAGDMIILDNNEPYGFSKTRAYYHKGDYFKIADVGEDYIDVTEESTDSYGDTVVDGVTYHCSIYKINTITAVVRNITLEHEFVLGTLSACLRISGGLGCIVDNVTASGVQFAHICFDHCYDSVIKNCKVDFDSPDVSYNYGVSVNSSKNISITDCYLKTRRHGLEFGGNVLLIPNRYIIVKGNIVDNYISKSVADPESDTEVGCFAPHFNSEFITLIGNIFKQGVVFAIPNSILKDNIIYSGDRCYYAVLLGFQGDNTIVEGNKIYYTSNAHVNIRGNRIPSQVISIGRLYADIESLTIRNNSMILIAGDSITSTFIYYYSNYEPKLKNLIIENNYFDCNNITVPVEQSYPNVFNYSDTGRLGCIRFAGNTVNKCSMRFDSSNYIDSLIIENNTILKSYIFIRLVAIEYITVYSNLIKDNTNYAIYCIDTQKVNIQDNIVFAPIENIERKKTLVCLQNSSNIVIRRNSLYQRKDDTALLYAFYLSGSVSNIDYRENIIKNTGTLVVYTAGSTVTDSNLVWRESGDPNQRPTVKDSGVKYFDNKLGIAIFWNGTVWVDENGTDVTYVTRTRGTTSLRNTMSNGWDATAKTASEGLKFYDTTLHKYVLWNGSDWVNLDGSALN